MLDVANHQRCLVEVVLGPEFPALNKTIRDSRFRTRFNAVILSLSREGKRVPGKLGDLTFRVGDTLLLEASHQFVEQYRFRRGFLLVSASGVLSIMEAAFFAAGGMIVSGCLTASRARRSVDLPVLVVIAASFALGNAMTETRAAN